MGCAGGLSLAMVFAIRGLLTAEAAPPLVHHMLPGDGSGASSSNPRANLNLPPREEVEVPGLDLNMIPSPSPEPSPPAEPEPSPDHLNQLLLAKRIELKNELASLILPILEGQATKVPLLERARIPSPLSFVDELIKGSVSCNVNQGNGPLPTCHELDCLNRWLMTRCNSLKANDPTQRQKEHETAIQLLISRKLHELL
ncbi:hypothetical protein CsSME_00054664 [Camellia sinensis var. sinensis]